MNTMKTFECALALMEQLLIVVNAFDSVSNKLNFVTWLLLLCKTEVLKKPQEVIEEGTEEFIFKPDTCKYCITVSEETC